MLSRRRVDHRCRLHAVDDCHPGAEATTAFLSLSGYEARFVLSGMTALRAIDGWTPASPYGASTGPTWPDSRSHSNGGSTGAPPHILIVAFTAQDESINRANGISARFDAYGQKDTGPDSLLRCLDESAAEVEV